jgi:ElaB/YqjD/DUF883 family membrane-anchored ribosome-binding protein
MSDSSSNAAKRVKAAAEKTTEELEARLASLRADLDEVLSAIAGKAEKQASEFSSSIASGPAQQIIEELRDVLAEAKKQAGNAEKKVTQTAREHPLEALLIAFGVGFLASFLLRR